MEKETEQKISQLQLLEANMQQFARQKQQFQAQLLEIESAMKELQKTEKAFKIVGNIMIENSKEDLNKDLKSKQDLLNIRIGTMEKQEKTLKDKAEKLQKEVLGKIDENKS